MRVAAQGLLVLGDRGLVDDLNCIAFVVEGMRAGWVHCIMIMMVVDELWFVLYRADL